MIALLSLHVGFMPGLKGDQVPELPGGVVTASLKVSPNHAREVLDVAKPLRRSLHEIKSPADPAQRLKVSGLAAPPGISTMEGPELPCY